ncbi:MAG TPA: helix-turn-helix domain-containing protein [Chitinophagaceae bacterium]|nr:helix-turn-helix domain-containing protein [Chitinophagaceae bacterium]
MAANTTNHIATFTLADISNDANALLQVKNIDGGRGNLKEQMFLPHRRNYYFFFLVKNGGSRHWVDFISYQVQPHTLYLTTPRQVHVKEKSEATQGTLLAFTEEFLTLCNDETLKHLPVIKNKFNRHALPLTAADEALLDSLLQQSVQEYNSSNTYRQAALQAYIKLFLVQVSRLYDAVFASDAACESGNTLFLQLTKLVDERINKYHQAVDYADALNVTVGHLNAVTKQQSGKTITELLQERLILEAKRLLFHSKLSVKEIAYQLNFEDAAYFNRVFKKLAGTTPLEFRKQNHEKYH